MYFTLGTQIESNQDSIYANVLFKRRPKIALSLKIEINCSDKKICVKISKFSLKLFIPENENFKYFTFQTHQNLSEN